MNRKILPVVFLFTALCIVNALSNLYFKRFDFSADQRYTLSEVSKELLTEVQSPIVIRVFLAGDLPANFKRLQLETLYLLEEYKAFNATLQFSFINPLLGEVSPEKIANEFYQRGMKPVQINEVEKGKVSERLLFPWATIRKGDVEIPVKLYQNRTGLTEEELVSISIQELEYQLTDAFTKLLNQRSKKIAVLRGKGQLSDAYIADLLSELKEYYFIAPFDISVASTNPIETLSQLKEFDLILDAKPEKKYTETEKYVLDQFIMKGGNALWLIDQVTAEKDSLYKDAGSLAFAKDLNLTDQFFSYGVRINPQLVNDLYSLPIILAQGSGSQTQFNPFPWFYEPLAEAFSNHPIVNNLTAVHFNFANPIDVLKSKYKITPLLASSPVTKIEGAPRELNLDMVRKKPAPDEYQSGSQLLSVLVEGEFNSLYKNRVLPFPFEAHQDKGEFAQQVFVSDGDIIKNEVKNGIPQELGFDFYTGNTYGNKEFLMNTFNYLLGDDNLVALRNKQLFLAKLSPEKVEKQALLWQVFYLGGIPILGFVVYLFIQWKRRKKYTYSSLSLKQNH